MIEMNILRMEALKVIGALMEVLCGMEGLKALLMM